MQAQPIQLDVGWEKLKTGAVQKIEGILEDMTDGVYQNRISTDEYSDLYTCDIPSATRTAFSPADSVPNEIAAPSTQCARKSRRTTGASISTTTTSRRSKTIYPAVSCLGSGRSTMSTCSGCPILPRPRPALHSRRVVSFTRPIHPTIHPTIHASMNARARAHKYTCNANIQ